MDKQNVVYAYNEYSALGRKFWHMVQMDEPWSHYTKRNKPVSKILCDSI